MPKLLIFNPPSNNNGASLAPLTSDGEKLDLTTEYSGSLPAFNIDSKSPTVLTLKYTFNGTNYYPTIIKLINNAYNTQASVVVGNENGINFTSVTPSSWIFNAGLSGGASYVAIKTAAYSLPDPILSINTGYAGQAGQVIKLAPSQTANAFEIQSSSSSTPIFHINSSGNIFLNNGQLTEISTGAGWSKISAPVGSQLRLYAIESIYAGIGINGNDGIRIDGSTTPNDTRLFLYDVNKGSLTRVLVGNADSGGSGYRILRVVN